MKEITRVAVRVAEVYEFTDAEDGQTYFFDATKGRQIALARNAGGHAVSPADFGMTKARILTMYPDLDRDRALALPMEALEHPILFVSHRDKHILVDGSHRLYIAMCCELTWLPAFVLTAFESAKIRLY